MSRQVLVNVITVVALVVVLAATLAGCGSTSTASSPVAAASATSGASSGTATAAASGSGEIEQLLAAAMSQPIDVSDPGPALDRAEQGMTDYLRGGGRRRGTPGTQRRGHAQ